MSDSGDDLSSAANIPADSEIESCLRTVVREALKADEAIAVNLARTRAETRLALDAGFLKDNAQWKNKSKEIIKSAFHEPPSPVQPKKTASKPKAKPAPKAGAKRKSAEPQTAKKKQKKHAVSDSEDDGALTGSSSDDITEHLSKPKTPHEDEGSLSEVHGFDADLEASIKATAGVPVDDESDLSSVLDVPPPKQKRQKKAAAPKATKARPAKGKKAPEPEKIDTGYDGNAEPTFDADLEARARASGAGDDNDSDLSSILDDPPPKKKGQKKDTTAKPKPAPKAKPAASTKPDLTPDEEEIKRLQSWLLKCGIRKLWHRELAPYDTSKQKIKHLKGMLEEVGMTGRYSAEKAKGIKEQRELKAELEAVGEFNEKWGHDEEDEEGSGGGGKGDGVEEKEAAPRQARKPRRFVDFGDSDEESD